MLRDIQVDKLPVLYSDYERCMEKIIAVVSNVCGVTSLYRMGNISIPGMSDIDLVITIDAERTVATQLLRSLEEDFTDQEKYLFYMHDPLITSESILPKIHYLRGATSLQYMWGKECFFEELDDVYLKFYLLCDLLIQYYPFVFHDSDYSPRIVLAQINAFRFVLDLVGDVAEGFSFDRQISAKMKDIDILLESNNQVRAELPALKTEVVNQFIKDAQKKILHFIDNINNVLSECLGRLFPESMKRCRDVNFANRQFVADYRQGVWRAEYPSIFHAVWFSPMQKDERILKAVSERNKVVDSYCGFIKNYVGGRGLYSPWWRQ